MCMYATRESISASYKSYMAKGLKHILTLKAVTVPALALALLLGVCDHFAIAASTDTIAVNTSTVAGIDNAPTAGGTMAVTVAVAPEVAAGATFPAETAETSSVKAAGISVEPDALVANVEAAVAPEVAAEADSRVATAGPAETAGTQVHFWRLPKDKNAGRPYNKHFRAGEVLKGDPALVHPDFLLDQNLLGSRRLTAHGDFRFTEEFTIYYRRNETGIDTSYLWNPSQMAELDRFMRKDIVVDTITVYAYASPEGHYGHNVWLSRRRAENARNYIVEEYGLDPGKVLISQQEENWPGLRQAVRNFYDGDNRDDLLEILMEEGLSDKERKDGIIALDGGKTYSFLIDTLMPPLRSAIFSISWSRRSAFDLPAVRWGGESRAGMREQTEERLQESEPITEEPDTIAKRTIVALKTNVLYDAATALNYQVEVPIGKNFSVVWEHYFPWWATKKELKYCLQYLTLGGEARWWFAPKPRPETSNRVLRDVLVGHYIGAYGLWGKADLQWQDKFGMYQCSPIFSAGLTYGFVTPITKHLNLELSVSAGYARIPYQHYIPSEDWQILWRDREDAGITHYFGPTKITVTLSMPILINYKPRKR